MALQSISESTQRSLKINSENTQRALRAHSESTQGPLGDNQENTQRTLREHPEHTQRNSEQLGDNSVHTGTEPLMVLEATRKTPHAERTHVHKRVITMSSSVRI